jgi:hypothetical protein
LSIKLFDLPVPLETVLLTQAWHPRLQSDPAHQWLRRTTWVLSNEDEVAAAKRSKA